MYPRRIVDELLNTPLPQAPVITLDKARGVGKIGTTLQRAMRAFLLDHPDQRALIEADPDGTRRPGTMLLDEWFRVPEVWDLAHRKVDNGAGPGSSLLIGPAIPAAAQGAHSGVGRILSLHIRLMALHERGQLVPTASLTFLLAAEPPCSAETEGHTSYCLADYLGVTAANGFPDIMSFGPDLRTEQLATYIQCVVDRDLPNLGYGARRPETLRRWLAAYAAVSSITISYSKLLDTTTCGDGQQSARGTTQTYHDHLTQLWLLDPVSGWSFSRSPFTRLQQAPKHQPADPAPVASLLGAIASFMTTPRHSHPIGPLSEALATLTVRVAAEATWARVGYLRTHNDNHKIGLIVETRDGRTVAIEAKLAASVTDLDVQHLVWLRSRPPEDVSDLVILTAGTTVYRWRDGVVVIPLALLGSQIHHIMSPSRVPAQSSSITTSGSFLASHQQACQSDTQRRANLRDRLQRNDDLYHSKSAVSPSVTSYLDVLARLFLTLYVRSWETRLAKQEIGWVKVSMLGFGSAAWLCDVSARVVRSRRP